MNNDDKKFLMQGNLGEYYYQRAILSFEQNKYEESVSCFIKAYNLGVYQEEIIDILYSCFILPNEEEFRGNYEKNAEMLTRFSYEETEIDFIPVSDTRYYLYNKVERKFYDFLDIQVPEKREKKFHGILISDIWDIRVVLQELLENEYSSLYFVLNEMKSKFYSFFKVPGFIDIFLKNVVCFDNTAIMEQFFEEYTDFYIPKRCVGRNVANYISVLDKIRKSRIENLTVERKNVFLSICIPSYNRGHVLLRNVSYLLGSQYDSEIEIVISDNGSTKNVEGYQEIRNMRDSRIKYVRFDENQGYASNVLNVLTHASGRFAMLISDEDEVMIENIGELLEKLYLNLDKGLIIVNRDSSIGGEEMIYRVGEEAIVRSVQCTYITGNVYNMDIVRTNQILEKCQEFRGNVFFEYYVHVVVGMFLGNCTSFLEFRMNLYNMLERCEEGGLNEDGKILLNYMTVESRLLQFEGVIRIMEKVSDSSELIKKIFLIYLFGIYKLLDMARKVLEEFRNRYVWKEVCDEVNKMAIRICREYWMPNDVYTNVENIYNKYLELE